MILREYGIYDDTNTFEPEDSCPYYEGIRLGLPVLSLPGLLYLWTETCRVLGITDSFRRGWVNYVHLMKHMAGGIASLAT